MSDSALDGPHLMNSFTLRPSVFSTQSVEFLARAVAFFYILITPSLSEDWLALCRPFKKVGAENYNITSKCRRSLVIVTGCNDRCKLHYHKMLSTWEEKMMNNSFLANFLDQREQLMN